MKIVNIDTVVNPVIRFNGKSYIGKLTENRVIHSGDEIEVTQEDAVKMLCHSSVGLWSPVNFEAFRLAELNGRPFEQGDEDELEETVEESVPEVEEEKPRCSFVKKNGERCQLGRTQNSEYCSIHQRIVSALRSETTGNEDEE